MSLLDGFKAFQPDRPAAVATASVPLAEDAAAYEPVRIQVLSDLHLEITRYYPLRPATDGDDKPPPYDYDFPVSAEILALLGDIGLTKDERLFDWLRVQLRRFKIVFFLSGNHEAYHSSLVRAVLFSHVLSARVADADNHTRPGRVLAAPRCLCPRMR